MVAHSPDGLDGYRRQQSGAQEGLDAREEKEQAHDGVCVDLGAAEDANSGPAILANISVMPNSIY